MAVEHRVAIVVGLLGVALLLNPIYLYPNGGGDVATTYTLQQIESEEEAVQALSSAPTVLTCPGARACRLEENVQERETVEYSSRVEGASRYDVVRIESNWYRPENDVSGESTTLTLQSVDVFEAVEQAAIPATETIPEVREGIESGSVTVYSTTVPSFERDAIVAQGGEHYFVSERSSSPHWTGGNALEFVRVVIFALGIGALLYAGGRLRRPAGE